jgi:hypothetical protein
MSACHLQATSPDPASAVSQQCGQASVKQPPVDLQTVVDEFMQSIPVANTAGYADPTKDRSEGLLGGQRPLPLQIRAYSVRAESTLLRHGTPTGNSFRENSRDRGAPTPRTWWYPQATPALLRLPGRLPAGSKRIKTAERSFFSRLPVQRPGRVLTARGGHKRSKRSHVQRTVRPRGSQRSSGTQSLRERLRT